MFTGIITGIGHISAVHPLGDTATQAWATASRSTAPA